MQVTLTHHTATRKSIEITVPAAEVSEEIGRVLAKLTPKVRIPGFRPGKAPKQVLMSRYEREIHQEVTENLVNRHFWNAAEAAGTQPISHPAIERAEIKEGTDGKFKALYDVAPEVKAPEYKGLVVTKKKRRIDDEAMAEQLEDMRQRAAKFVPVEDSAAEGHYATLDIKVKPQGMKSQSYSDQVIQLAAERPFDKEILGMKLDEHRKFDIEIPANDPNRAMAGKKVHYEAHLKDLRARVVPELNDEFAKDMGDYENLEALRAFLTKDLEEAAERDAVARMQSTMLEMLLDAAPFEVPATMVGLQLDDYCQEFANMLARQGVDPRKVNWSAYRQGRMRDAERAVRSGYLLQSIGNAEDIQVTDEEVEKDIRDFMAEHKIETPFEAFKADLEKRGGTTEIKGRIRTDKIFERLASFATVTEELLDKAAFEELAELERKREAGQASARFDAGGLEGGELAEQEGGAPDAVKAAEEGEAPAEETAEPAKSKKTKKAENAESLEAEAPKAASKKAKKAEEPAEEAPKPKRAPKKAADKAAE